jgi:hypothetical protein
MCISRFFGLGSSHIFHGAQTFAMAIVSADLSECQRPAAARYIVAQQTAAMRDDGRRSIDSGWRAG